ncbi:MAG: hypothetical protein EXR76_01750 [Myxococcales bacterium]|nr:hypothetical protein [Myxococcales bacterium]
MWRGPDRGQGRPECACDAFSVCPVVRPNDGVACVDGHLEFNEVCGEGFSWARSCGSPPTAVWCEPLVDEADEADEAEKPEWRGPHAPAFLGLRWRAD